MKPSLNDVKEYLDSIDLQMVMPKDLRKVFKCNAKEYHYLRTQLARWSQKGLIDNPTKGYYRAFPKITTWNDALKRIPPENAKFHNFQLIGRLPKQERKGAWGVTATIRKFQNHMVVLSWGGNCKITRHLNRTIEFQTCNSKRPWEIPDVFRFFGWLEMFCHPYEFWEIDLRVKQFDIHIDSEFFTLAPGTSIKIGHIDTILLQIYNKRPLGVTRVEFPAKVNLTPGQFIDLFYNMRGGFD